jgi:hypothetical protein
MTRLRTVAVVSMMLLAALPMQASAQATAAQASGASRVVDAQPTRTLVVGQSDQDARQLRREFLDVMKKYPPSLGAILKLDPTLMSNPTYMAPYPLLQAFLTAHPEVQKNPSYFLESFSDGAYYDTRTWSAGERIWNQIFDGIGVLTIFGTIVGVVTWLIRTFIDYRRWARLSKVQAEVHTKLLDRFTANDELIAYVQSPAGSKFLESAPISLDPGARRLGAPVSRILWSSQVGLVLIMAGFALQYVSGRIDADAQQPVFSIGVVALAIGVGFLLSSAASYVISRRLGLFEPPASGHPSNLMGSARPSGPGA